ncbi:MAG: cyclic nucleotide-binding domain-containing protein [Alphaproteobacteria bacterium]|nr:cyclic nucleotide-binding domain-containing protein [Alphaproteobacteria bacterium]
MRNTVVLDRRFVAQGTKIIEQGDFGNYAYLIQSGAIRIFSTIEGEKKVLGELGPGEIFGEMSLISDGPRVASAEAIEDTNLIMLSRQALLKKIEDSDPTVRAIVKMLMKRLEENNRRVLGIESKVEQNWPTVFKNIYRDMLVTMNTADKYECQDLTESAFEQFASKLDDFFRNKASNS